MEGGLILSGNPVFSGDKIEELQSVAGDHLFMHAQQVNDWRGNLKIFTKGEGVWVEDVDGNRLLRGASRVFFQPETRSQPSLSLAIRFPISTGAS